jgi:hypothetical protein
LSIANKPLGALRRLGCGRKRRLVQNTVERVGHENDGFGEKIGSVLASAQIHRRTDTPARATSGAIQRCPVI